MNKSYPEITRRIVGGIRSMRKEIPDTMAGQRDGGCGDKDGALAPRPKS